MKRFSYRTRWTAVGILVFIGIPILGPFVTSAVQIHERTLNEFHISPVDFPHRTTLYVGGFGPNNYSKIQDAVDNASDGDSIYVYQGIYYEHVIINKQVTLIGQTRDQTKIDGNGSGNVIKIQADGVTIKQFSLQHGGIGVYIVHSSNNSILRNSIMNNWEGIGLLNSSYCLISGNTIAQNGFEGINPVQTTFTTISENTIIDHLQGIYLVESTENTIFSNILSSNSRGIEIQQSSNNNYIFHNNFFASEENNAYDKCSNTWDDGYPSGGNYWDDYNGGDANHDGIGDTPYTIPGGNNNKDHYPLMSIWNHPPAQPTDPNPLNGVTNVPINPVLSVSVYDPDEDAMNVSFYDASTQHLIGVDVNVASSTRASVIWSGGLENMTLYRWYAIADDGKRTNQSEIWEFTTGNGTNQHPAAPTINGPAFGKVGQTYEYTFITTDPNGDDVSYYIDWGDTTNSGWIGPNQSNEQVIVSHTWTTRGTYTIKAKAKDVYEAESEWGSFKIRMPKGQIHTTFLFVHFLERLFERFPHAFPLLRYILDFN